ncbi:MAG: hypothetical protein WB952_08110 [Terriglobales bacterium]
MGRPPKKPYERRLTEDYGLTADRANPKRYCDQLSPRDMKSFRESIFATDDSYSLFIAEVRSSVEDDCSITLSPALQRDLELTFYMFEILFRKGLVTASVRDAVCKKSLTDARTCTVLRDTSKWNTLPAQLGSVEEFKRKYLSGELDVDFKPEAKTPIQINFYSMPPDEDEDLDPADEPRGHWDGLVWHQAEAEGS